MSTNRQSTPCSDLTRAKPRLRWVAVLLVSILLHAVALEWANGVITMPDNHDEEIKTVTMVQLQAPLLPAPAADHPKPKAANKARPHPKAKPAHPVVPDAAPTTALTQDTATGNENNAPEPAESNAIAEAAAEPLPPAATDVAKADPAPEKPAQPRYKIDLPPPAELKYEVKKVPIDGRPMYGSGTISWQSAGGSYSVSGEAHVLFISAFNFKSEGVLDDYGIAPVLYSQKSFRRSETNTHFNRDERNSISFSSSTISYPIMGGEQDRGSIMWELAGIGRGDPDKFLPGAQIDLFVAGVRDGDIWSIQVAGQEEIETGDGKTLAWHVVRTPRAGTYEQKIDIWLAPQFQWSPVKIRYTEKNGDYLDMSMTSFQPLPAASALAGQAR